MTEYTMDTFYAEMEKRGVRSVRPKHKVPKEAAPRALLAPPEPRHGTRAFYNLHKCRCTACRAANSAYYHRLKQKRNAAQQPSSPPFRPWIRGGQPRQPATLNGNTIETVVACGVHPLHYVKVRANGSRSGCPMCEMQIESICHAFSVRR